MAITNVREAMQLSRTPTIEKQESISYDGMHERAMTYRERVMHIMRGFERRVAARPIVHELLGDAIEISRFSGPMRVPQETATRRVPLADVYVHGYLVTQQAGDTHSTIPENGIFIGFIERQGYTISQGTDKEKPVIIPEHWGVITVDDLLNHPYAMSSRLTGRPSKNRFSAENLRLHEDLNPAHAGWENACLELEEYLSHPDTISHARDIITQGIAKLSIRS